MIYSPWDMEHNILKLVILGKFLPFYPSLKTLKIKILKDEKNFSRYHHFTNVYKKWLEILSFYTYMCTLNEDHMIYSSWNIRCSRQIFVILGHFLPFQSPDNPENQNFKIEKNTWRYYHFTHLHHKWQSYDVWFLRYGARQT